MRKKTVNSK